MGLLFMCFKLQKSQSENAFLWVYIGTVWAAVPKDIFSFLTAIGKGNLDQITLCPQL